MDIRELYRARIENRFGLKHYVQAWIISARLFAIPWVVLYTLFGILLAGVTSIERAVSAVLIVTFTLLAAHFNNNYRDVEIGVDKYVESIEEAEKILSRMKPYTAAAWIVPLRITSIKFQKINELVFTTLSIATYLVSFTKNPVTTITTAPILALGILLARTYTSIFKKHRLGEISSFLGHGFGTTCFGYLSQKPDVIAAILAGIPTGLLSGLVYSIDQFIDIKTDFVERVRSIYESWFNSRMPLGLYVLIITVFWYNTVIAWVAAGLYPRGVLITLSLIPIILYLSPQLEYNREKTLLKMIVVATTMIPLLMCIGALIK